jgi:raffinose/stachyose/melibiose transport system substrate-binding protein
MSDTSSPFAAPLSRRTVLGAFGAGLGSLALSACGGPGASSSESSATTSGGGVTGRVSFYHWRTEDRQALEDLGAAFAKKYPGARVEQTIDPSEQYEATAAQKAGTGSVGDALTAFRGPQFTQFAELGTFADLSSVAYKDNYVAEFITHGASQGKQLGFPYQLLFNMPLLNTDIAEKAGLSEPATDWDSYLNGLDRLKAQGVYAIAWPGNDFQILNSLAMNAPDDQSFAAIEQGKAKVTDDWFLDLLRKWKQMSAYFQPNFAGTKLDGALALYTQGKAAMLPTGSFHIIQARAAGAKFGIEFAPVITTPKGQAPRNEGIYNVTFILGVNAKAKNPEGAKAWVEFLSQPENAVKYADTTYQHVTVKDVQYTNADLKALAPWTERKLLLAPRFQFASVGIRSAVENTLLTVATGTSVEQAAEAAQKLVDEQRPK